MKSLYIILFFAITANKAFCQVMISGEFKNVPPASEVEVTYYNNNIEWHEVSAGKTKLDDQGKFTLSFPLDKAKTATLVVGEQQTNLFLVPNDSFQIKVDYNNFDSTIYYTTTSYTGKGAADNNYMAAEVLVDFNKKANRYSLYTDADKYKLYQDSIEKANWDFFKAHDSPEFSPEFRSYMTATIKYRFINSRWMYKVGYDKVNKKIFDKPVPENYFDFLKTIDLNDQEAFDNSSYDVALTRYLYEMNDAKVSKEIPDSLTELQKKKIEISKNYSYRKNIFRGKILDFQLTTYLKEEIGFVADDAKFCEALIKDYKSTCKKPEYIVIIDKTYELANRLSFGKIAPDFTLVNADGKQISLSSLKGKIVYVDFWATWCVPCIAAMKHSHELMEKLKGKNDVVFLYVNVSDDMERWKNYLIKEKMEGINLFATKEQSDNLNKSYNFNGIPHYVLIDKQGKLINSNAERPGDVEKTILEASK